MNNILPALAALLVPALAGAAPLLDGIAVRDRGPGVEFHAAGHLGQLAPADLADADRVVSALPADVALPTAARTPGSFRLGKTFRLPTGGAIQRLEQRIAGIPVEGGSLSVRLDGANELRWTAGQVFDPAKAPAARPALTATAAVQFANAISRVPSANRDRARLVYLPVGANLALAYRVDLPAQPGQRLDAPTVWVDAASGQVLKRVNRLRFFHQASVWPNNPVATPDRITVDLPAMPGDATQLKGEWVEARNCVDEHQTVSLSYGGGDYAVHVCTERSKATADANGDFFFDPVMDLYDSAGDVDDFAEAHGYYHVMRAYAFFQGLGLTEVGAKPLPTTVNYRYPFSDYDSSATWENAQNPYGELFPYDNAFFLPGGQGLFGEDRPFDSIVFGQGSQADFGYDGSVFYHEFTHAVVQATCNLGWAFLDAYGLDGAPGAMNEGYADYFSHAITEDPLIGEYANGGYGAIRDAQNDATCPGSLVGETHEDSNVWTGGLWDVRELLGARTDQAVYNALIGLPSEASFQTAAEATIAEIGTLIGEDAAAQARTAFEARGLLGCNNRIVDIARSGGGRPFMMLGATYMGYDPMPSYLQFRIDAADPITSLSVSIDSIYTDRDYPAEVSVVAKLGEPIQFRSPFGSRVSGDWDFEVQLSGTRGVTGDFETPQPAGPVYFALINRGTAEAYIDQFSIEWRETPDDPGTGGSGGAGGTGGVGGTGGTGGVGGVAPDPEDHGSGADSSGCNQAGSSPAALGLLAVAAALVARRRRS
jgi:hypothetical protein